MRGSRSHHNRIGSIHDAPVVPASMTAPLSLTLFVKSDDPASDRACQDLQAALAVMTVGPSVRVDVIGEREAADLGISIAPVLRIQRGNKHGAVGRPPGPRVTARSLGPPGPASDTLNSHSAPLIPLAPGGS